MFGWEVFPAKSGKDENSIEKETNPSNGIPAFAGVDAQTEIVEGCLGGPMFTERDVQNDVQTSHKTKYTKRYIVEMSLEIEIYPRNLDCRKEAIT